jgi:hypothetical protein
MEKSVDKKQIDRVRKMTFSTVYPLYIAKVERKGFRKKDVDRIIEWLTGYSKKEIEDQINNNVNLESFFDKAQKFNPNAVKITGTICGYRIEEIEDSIVRKVRYLDKLVDEIAKGKKAEDLISKYSEKPIIS